MTHPYAKCRDVRIMVAERPRVMFIPFWLEHDDSNEPEQWFVLHHQGFKKYIVTNSFIDNPAFATSEIDVVGFADTIDGAMFTVWEHQVSRGCQRTILDDIREWQRECEASLKRKEASAWEWARPKVKCSSTGVDWEKEMHRAYVEKIERQFVYGIFGSSFANDFLRKIVRRITKTNRVENARKTEI